MIEPENNKLIITPSFFRWKWSTNWKQLQRFWTKSVRK